jgi:hypothetical protein
MNINRRQLLKAAAFGTWSQGIITAPRIWAKDTQILRVISRGDVNSNYSLGLLKMALEKAGVLYRLDINEGDFAPMRQRQELVEGKLDVMWSATSIELEDVTLPIRVPLYKGSI